MLKSIAILLPIFIALFWAIVLLTTREQSPHKPKRFLGLFMFTAFALYCTHAVFYSNLFYLYAYLESVYILTMLLIVPMYYVYLSKMVNEPKSSKKILFYALPAIILSVISLLTTFFLADSEKIYYVQEVVIHKRISDISFSSLPGFKIGIFYLGRLFMVFQIIIFATKAIRLAIRHNHRVANYYSNIEGKTLKWEKVFSIGIILIAVFVIIQIYIGRSYFSHNPEALIYPGIVFGSIMFAVAFKGNYQLEISEEILYPAEEEKVIEEPQNKHSELLKQQLLSKFENEKIYRSRDLRITSISEELKTNRTYISRLINDEFGMNFNEFVNKYRVGEAKRLLLGEESTTYTMEYISEEAGFGSVASFTRVFKEMEGLTPGQFRQKKSVPA